MIERIVFASCPCTRTTDIISFPICDTDLHTRVRSTLCIIEIHAAKGCIVRICNEQTELDQ